MEILRKIGRALRAMALGAARVWDRPWCRGAVYGTALLGGAATAGAVYETAGALWCSLIGAVAGGALSWWAESYP